MILEALPLLPPGLSASVVTTVFVGVVIMTSLNLRLGWTYSGLVVPGYLTPLFIVRPGSAVVIVVEALVCYAIAWALIRSSHRIGLGAPVFGRDRFFLIILTSIGVRLFFEGWLINALGGWLVRAGGPSLGALSDLHGFGLIIVALMANQLWKPGLARGSLTLGVAIAATFIVVRYGLMELTNFNIGNLELMYEDVAASILASPKAYMILVVTAFAASRLNLLYGWEFSGILVPALLALQWNTPSRILTTMIEAWIVLGLAAIALRLPFFSRRTIEKASKTRFFFTISFLYKAALAWTVVLLDLDVQAGDLYGFGYLLPSLIAIKMHEKGLPIRMGRFILQTTFASAIIAALAGFSLSLLPEAGLQDLRTSSLQGAVDRTDTSLIDAIDAVRIELYSGSSLHRWVAPSTAQLGAFKSAIATLLARPDSTIAANSLSDLGFRVEHLNGGVVLIRDAEEGRGWGVYALAAGHPGGATFEVPAPLSEWATPSAAAFLFDHFEGRALAISGLSRRIARGTPADVLAARDTMYQAFHVAVAMKSDVVQVRGHDETGSSLDVTRGLPESLDLPGLESSLDGELQVHFGRSRQTNLQRRLHSGHFAELRLDRASRRRLLARPRVTEMKPSVHDVKIGRYLQRRLLTSEASTEAGDRPDHRPPSPAELLFIDEEILTPLLRLLAAGSLTDEATAREREAQSSVASAAARIGYEMTWYRHDESRNDHLVLEERDPRRGWGSYAFRVSGGEPVLIEIPRPFQELQTLEVGIDLHHRLQATTLLIAGAEPSRHGPSSDVLARSNPGTVFNLVHQRTLSAATGKHLTILVRGTSRVMDVDAVLAFDPLAPVAGSLEGRLTEALDMIGFDWAIADGGVETSGLEVDRFAQMHVVREGSEARLVALWLASRPRSSFRRSRSDKFQRIALEALAIPEQEVPIDEDLSARTWRPTDELTQAAIKRELVAFLERGDVVALKNLSDQYPHLERRRDRDTQQDFLLISDDSRSLFAVANLQQRSIGQTALMDEGFDAEVLAAFLTRRDAILMVAR